jgi:1-aminocyclopropane-1-carboxylate deaminase
MPVDILKADIEEIRDELFVRKQVTVSVLRLDKIHPLVSGNKIFKLHYFLEEAVSDHKKTVLTFGGAYSNHLAATAFACRTLQIKCIGVVRGERPAVLSVTLQQCLKDGMQLHFISRQEYAKKEGPYFINALLDSFGDCIIIPEGGYHQLGAKGASKILDLIKDNDYSHICTASGTTTTLAGILMAAKPCQTVVGFPVLKGVTDNIERIKKITQDTVDIEKLMILNNYHFGGYAKRTDQLINFMNECWLQYQLPLDFVYTAKMFFGIIDTVKSDTFTKGSKILCIHTGGLQGNKSLPLNSLLF